MILPSTLAICKAHLEGDAAAAEARGHVHERHEGLGVCGQRNGQVLRGQPQRVGSAVPLPPARSCCLLQGMAGSARPGDQNQ